MPSRRLLPYPLALVLWALLTTPAQAAFLPPGADFNGDGFSDLAVGAPEDSVQGQDAAGAVNVLYGGGGGLSARGDQQFTQASPGLEAPEPGDRFGAALAAGDFDGDGYDDLAVGVPGEGIPSGVGPDEADRPGAGLVHVLYGSSTGLRSGGADLWTQDVPGVRGGTEAGDRFGQALAVADFDGDRRDDLGIGVPHEGVAGTPSAGAVNVLYGGSHGLTEAGDQLWTLDSSGVKGRSGRDFRMGFSLAGGDLSRNGAAELAIGVPGGTIAGQLRAGAVLVLYGRSGGLSSVDDLWSQGARGVGGGPERGDRFGAAVAIGDFDGDDDGDLAVGVPGEGLRGGDDAGAVNVLYGSGTGLRSAGDDFWCQSCGLKGGSEAGDAFGSALVAVDFSRNVAAELVVGVPGEGLGAGEAVGAVNIIYGNRGSGLGTRATGFECQDCSGVKGKGAAGDAFGWSLSAGDFDADNAFDLVIGVPGHDAAGSPITGAVNVLPGSGGGVTERGDQLWTQGSPGVDGTPGPDRFGAAVTSGSR